MKGDDIKKMRSLIGLTQEELAQKMGVTRNTIVNYEKGGVIPPAKQKLLSGVLSEVKGGVFRNTGIVNTGHIGGDNITIADPSAKKIKGGTRVEVNRDVSAENYPQTIDSLKTRIADLESALEFQKSEYERIVGTLERVIEAKNDLINALKK